MAVQGNRKIITITGANQEVLVPILKERFERLGEKITHVDDIAITCNKNATILFKTIGDDPYFDGLSDNNDYTEHMIEPGEIASISNNNDTVSERMMKVGSAVVTTEIGAKVKIEISINRR